MKTRLDQILVERGLADSREKARALILAGQRSGGRPEDRQAGPYVSRASAASKSPGRMPYVSRGGFKLAAALEHFGIDVRGRVCLDVGSSTGGFTDCLLQRGAASVWAVDVGHGQLDWKLAQRSARGRSRRASTPAIFSRATFPEHSDLAVCDASFISATLLIPGHCSPAARGNMVKW